MENKWKTNHSIPLINNSQIENYYLYGRVSDLFFRCLFIDVKICFRMNNRCGVDFRVNSSASYLEPFLGRLLFLPKSRYCVYIVNYDFVIKSFKWKVLCRFSAVLWSYANIRINFLGKKLKMKTEEKACCWLQHRIWNIGVAVRDFTLFDSYWVDGVTKIS